MAGSWLVIELHGRSSSSFRANSCILADCIEQHRSLNKIGSVNRPLLNGKPLEFTGANCYLKLRIDDKNLFFYIGPELNRLYTRFLIRFESKTGEALVEEPSFPEVGEVATVRFTAEQLQNGLTGARLVIELRDCTKDLLTQANAHQIPKELEKIVQQLSGR